MGRGRRMSLLSRAGMRHIGAVFMVVVLSLLGTPVLADDAEDARQLVERAKFAIDNFAVDPNMDGFRELMKHARGVFIAPQVIRIAFIIGGAGGSGVLLAKDDRTQQWGGPTFHSLGEGSIGIQIGGEASEVVLLAMTERGVAALLSTSVKLGADATIAVGPIGVGASAATANFSVDLISYSRSKGLYGGVSVQGAVVGVREAWNHAYYGQYVTPADVLLRRSVTNPHAEGLVGTVNKLSAWR